MEQNSSVDAVLAFRCPSYTDLPDMGLYLEQILTLVNSLLAPIQSEPLTGAMVSGYIKNGALPAPVRKKYYREHMAYLVCLCLLKQVFTVGQIGRFFRIQQGTYPLEVAYDYFCREYENALNSAFRFTGEAMPRLETHRTEQTILVRAMVLAAANRVYAEKVYFSSPEPEEPGK